MPHCKISISKFSFCCSRAGITKGGHYWIVTSSILHFNPFRKNLILLLLCFYTFSKITVILNTLTQQLVPCNAVVKKHASEFAHWTSVLYYAGLTMQFLCTIIIRIWLENEK